MAVTTTEKKTRKPREAKKLNYDQVLQAAHNLPLGDRAALCKEMKSSVNSEIEALKEKAEYASKAIEGI